MNDIVKTNKLRQAIESAKTPEEAYKVEQIAKISFAWAKENEVFEDAFEYSDLLIRAECNTTEQVIPHIKHGGDRKSQNWNQGDIDVTLIPDLNWTKKQFNRRCKVLEAFGADEIYNEYSNECLETKTLLYKTVLVKYYEKVTGETQRNAERTELIRLAEDMQPDERWNIWCADMRHWKAPHQYDFIITDPPYKKEYLKLYEDLAICAKEWLKDDGLMAVMCGQSYLDYIYPVMSRHIHYYWTGAYLTLGESAHIWQKQAIPKFKPILIFTKQSNYKGKVFADVFQSGENSKELHQWGQSISGMFSIISGLCSPGQSILDPFCGGGTTGIAALRYGCLFDGVDIDAESVAIAKGRMMRDSQAI